MTVVVVTDAASRLPADLLDKWAIRVVPLHILLDGIDLRDGVDEIPDDLYQRHATTAAATPAELADAYRQALADSGGDGVVAVHISSALSGTYGAAERTAADLDPAIRVLDSKSAAMGTGFVALAAARAAADGADLDAVAGAARSAVSRSHAFIVVHRLDNLRRSGRIGGPEHGWAPRWRSSRCCASMTANSFWPNEFAPSASATATMIDRVCEVVGEGSAASGGTPRRQSRRRAEVAAALARRLPGCEPAIVTPLGPVLALHVGAGAVAVCLVVNASV